MRTYSASEDATGLRFAVVVSRFNHMISSRLLEGCTAEFSLRGAASEDIHVAWVPGAFEIPIAARTLAKSGRYDAIVVLGAVIRGGTPHFDYVCNGVTDGIRDVMRDANVPVAFGLLTTDDVEQAIAFGLPGHGEWIILLVLGLLIFGRRLPEVGRSIGRSIVEFKKGIKGIEDDIEDSSTQSPSRQVDHQPAQQIADPPDSNPSSIKDEKAAVGPVDADAADI